MGFVSNMPDDDYRAATVGMNQPATPFVPGMFTGSLDALEKGIVGAVGKMGKTYDMLAASQGAAATGQYGWAQSLVPPSTAPPVEPVDLAKDAADNAAALKGIQDWSQIDPRTHGVAAQIAGSTAQGLTIMGLGSLMGTPLAGAGALGVTEGSNDYADTTAAGIDPNTALAKAGLTGVAAFAGAAVPMAVSSRVAMRLAGMGLSAEVAGNTALSSVFYGAGRAAATMAGTAAGKIATSGVAMTAFGAGNRFLTSHLLESAGYPEMAAQYKTLDAQAVVSDLVLGLAFGAGGVMGEKLGEKLNPLERPDPSQVEAALEGRKAEMRARGAAGLPTDPATAGLDAELSDRALGNMLRGKEAGVTPDEAVRIVEGSIVDPERVQLHEDMTKGFEAVYGDLAETQPPKRIEPAVEPFAQPEPVVEGAPPAPESTSGLSPMADEAAQQLAARHPDLDVQMPDGSTVKASQMPDALNEQMAKASQDSNLFSTAIGCFLRTML